jgi:hypothetical protein
VLVSACAVVLLAGLAQPAFAAPKPEAPPHQQGGSLRPDPGPGAANAKSSSSTSAPKSSAVSTQTRAVAPVFVPIVVRPANAAPAAAATPAAPRRHASLPKAHPAARDPGRPVGLRDAAGLDELTAAAGSTGSAWLLVAGLVLVLFVIGETAFLGLAGARLGVAGQRVPSRRGSPEEPYPIRRIQLRR